MGKIWRPPTAMLARVQIRVSRSAIRSGGLRSSIDAGGGHGRWRSAAVLPFFRKHAVLHFRSPVLRWSRRLENGVSQIDEVAGRSRRSAGQNLYRDPSADAGQPHQRMSPFRAMPLEPERPMASWSNNLRGATAGERL